MVVAVLSGIATGRHVKNMRIASAARTIREWLLQDLGLGQPICGLALFVFISSLCCRCLFYIKSRISFLRSVARTSCSANGLPCVLLVIGLTAF